MLLRADTAPGPGRKITQQIGPKRNSPNEHPAMRRQRQQCKHAERDQDETDVTGPCVIHASRNNRTKWPHKRSERSDNTSDRPRFKNCTNAEHGPLRRVLDKVASGRYFRLMKSVGLKTLKNRLSEYVRMASRGEVILVTDRDEVVAELAPPSATRSNGVPDALLAECVRKGYVRPATLPQQGPPPRKPVAGFKQLMKELESDRSDR